MGNFRQLTDIFTPTHYDLTLDLAREQRTFSGTVRAYGTLNIASPIVLHAKGLVIDAVLINEREATFSVGPNDELLCEQANLALGDHIVQVTFHGVITDPMHGLYPCYYEVDGQKQELLATQFESHHAREVFPCIDEPAGKATFDVTLITEKEITVLGNTPAKRQDISDNRLTTTFETTPIMSPYLLAFVTGDLQKKSARSQKGVEVTIYATKAQPAASLDFALEVGTKVVDFYGDYFGTDYPLSKCDHVALPDFSSGAMENWGLITYREIALLADPATTSISSKHYIATVIAHEVSHQWFGNLVTMKWWNNLWLNESFANLMEYVAVDALYPDWNTWLDYSSHETIMALRRDALDGVQAVQTDVNHPDEISTLFDGAIVYAKGGRLLRMLQYYIGHDAFKAGLKSYFKKYAYQNTVGDNLWDELSAASGKNVTDFMNAWISQPGYPVVHVEDNGLYQEQFFVGPHQNTGRVWPLPLNATNSDMPELMDTARLDVSLTPGERLNKGDTAHFITHYPTVYLAAITDDIKAGKLQPIDRLQLLHEQTMLARGGVISSAELIPLLQAYSGETTEQVWDIIALAIGELKKFVEHDEAAEQNLRNLARTIAETEYQRLGWQPNKGESESDSKLRATILGLTIYGEDPEALKTANQLFSDDDLSQLDPELRSLIISTAVRHFETDARIDHLIETYRTTASSDLQLDICAGLTSSKNAKTIQKLLLSMKDTTLIRPQDLFRWFAYMMRGRESRQATWQWLKDNWQWLEQSYAGDKSYDDFPRYAAAGMVNRDDLADYRNFFAPMQNNPSLKRVIELGLGEIEGRLELVERDQAAVQRALNDAV